MRLLLYHYEESPPFLVCQVLPLARQLQTLGHVVRIEPDNSGTTAALSQHEPCLTYWQRRFGFAHCCVRNRTQLLHDREVLRVFSPDVVLLYASPYRWSMTQACREAGVPLLTVIDQPAVLACHQQGDLSMWHPPWLVAAIERWNLRHSQVIITTNRAARQRLRGYRLSALIHVIPWGVEREWFAPLADAQRQELGRAVGVTAPLVIGFLGPVAARPERELLRQLLQATSARKDAQWLVIGAGPAQAFLEQAVARPGGAVFLDMPLPPRLGPLLQLMDVVAAPCVTEATLTKCPLNILQCAAAGRALLASARGDIPLLLDRGRAGLLVCDDDAETWLNLSRRLLDQPRLRQELGQHARRWVLRRFSWRRAAQAIDRLLPQALKLAERRTTLGV
ncbi:MAG: glycosyltransferase family 4 protein [Gemmataceae bacterium]